MALEFFYDLYGQKKIPSKSDIVRARKSIHLVIFNQDKVLVSYPLYALDCPELAGGGIEADEDMFKAATRELREEAGLEINFTLGKTIPRYQKSVNYYAKDVKEFWHYDMTFWALKAKDCLLGDWQQPEWYNENGEKVAFVKVTDEFLDSMQFFHQDAVKYFLNRF